MESKQKGTLVSVLSYQSNYYNTRKYWDGSNYGPTKTYSDGSISSLDLCKSCFKAACHKEDQEAGNKKKRKNVSGLLEEFCEETTAHGFARCKKEQSKWLRFFWGFLTVGVFVGIAVHLMFLVINFLRWVEQRISGLNFVFVLFIARSSSHIFLMREMFGFLFCLFQNLKIFHNYSVIVILQLPVHGINKTE